MYITGSNKLEKLLLIEEQSSWDVCEKKREFARPLKTGQCLLTSSWGISTNNGKRLAARISPRFIPAAFIWLYVLIGSCSCLLLVPFYDVRVEKGPWERA